MGTEEVVGAYVRAWHERDASVRRRLVEQSWADDAVYVDPETIIEGCEALLEAIAAFQAERPDVRIEVRSRIDQVGTDFRFVWATVDGSGAVLREGIDFGRLNEHGRIASITGFFGVLP